MEAHLPPAARGDPTPAAVEAPGAGNPKDPSSASATPDDVAHHHIDIMLVDPPETGVPGDDITPSKSASPSASASATALASASATMSAAAAQTAKDRELAELLSGAPARKKRPKSASASSLEKGKKKTKKKYSSNAYAMYHDIPNSLIVALSPEAALASGHKNTVLLCTQPTHTATQLQISPSGLTVTNSRGGYRLCKASHGVYQGKWYYEVTVGNETCNARVGWAQISADLQTPCGYDAFSYAWRQRPGTLFHMSDVYAPPAFCGISGNDGGDTGNDGGDTGNDGGNTGNGGGDTGNDGENTGNDTEKDDDNTEKDDQEKAPAYSDGFNAGDVIGIGITLPDVLLPMQVNELSQRLWNRQSNPKYEPFKREPEDVPGFYASMGAGDKVEGVDNSAGDKVEGVDNSAGDKVEGVDENAVAGADDDGGGKQTAVTEIKYWRNGKCLGTAFRGLLLGKYHPSVSIYAPSSSETASATVNFGPVFQSNGGDPPKGYRAMSECASSREEEDLFAGQVVDSLESFIEA
ncbi:MAG: hypothetical protein SGCHY_000934 [Lobulomycetales sp.]